MSLWCRFCYYVIKNIFSMTPVHPRSMSYRNFPNCHISLFSLCAVFSVAEISNCLRSNSLTFQSLIFWKFYILNFLSSQFKLSIVYLLNCLHFFFTKHLLSQSFFTLYSQASTFLFDEFISNIISVHYFFHFPNHFLNHFLHSVVSLLTHLNSQSFVSFLLSLFILPADYIFIIYFLNPILSQIFNFWNIYILNRLFSFGISFLHLLLYYSSNKSRFSHSSTFSLLYTLNRLCEPYLFSVTLFLNRPFSFLDSFSWIPSSSSTFFNNFAFVFSF